jgi:acyl-CoA synthetase (AMP-forming)/AMP-acid ligase II
LNHGQRWRQPLDDGKD